MRFVFQAQSKILKVYGRIICRQNDFKSFCRQIILPKVFFGDTQWLRRISAEKLCRRVTLKTSSFAELLFAASQKL